mgnify:CR=1 FL=1
MTLDLGLLAGAVVIVVGSLTTATLRILKQVTASRLQILAATNSLQAKVAIVEHATNSIATRNAAIIASQEIQISMLRDALSKSENTALLLAQTKAVRAVDTVTGQTLAVHDAWEKGEREKTSAAIQENTDLTREIRDAVVPKVEP